MSTHKKRQRTRSRGMSAEIVVPSTAPMTAAAMTTSSNSHGSSLNDLVQHALMTSTALKSVAKDTADIRDDGVAKLSSGKKLLKLLKDRKNPGDAMAPPHTNASKKSLNRVPEPMPVPSHPEAFASVKMSAMDTDDEDELLPLPTKSKSIMETHIRSSKFADLSIAAATKKALAEVLQYTYMTDVQEASIPVVLSGRDVFVKAKTGTGKTLAFLIPTIERTFRDRKGSAPGQKKSKMLIISPTRELALQIATEAEQLATFWEPSLSIATFLGGRSVSKDMEAIRRNPDIIIATPGRLLMHLEETRGFAADCKSVSSLVLDEADRLLDMGFKPDIDRIASYLSQQTDKVLPRQTLLFSATFADEVKGVAGQFLRRDYQLIDTVGDDEEQTHSHVPQHIMSVPIHETIKALMYTLEQQMTKSTSKVIVFFPTAKQTAYMAALASSLGIDVLEIHSRMSLPARTRASDQFRDAKKAILFSSDVTARGMDYPDVTLVVQMGMTNREQYIHRLGRTARAGKDGAGLLICNPFEMRPMQAELSDLPLTIDEMPTEKMDADRDFTSKLRDLDRKQRALDDEAQKAWIAWLGFYKSLLKKLHWSIPNLVTTSHEIAKSFGLLEIPAIPAKTIGKMGLKGVAGLKVDHSPSDRSFHGSRMKSKPESYGSGGSRSASPSDMRRPSFTKDSASDKDVKPYKRADSRGRDMPSSGKATGSGAGSNPSSKFKGPSGRRNYGTAREIFG